MPPDSTQALANLIDPHTLEVLSWWATIIGTSLAIIGVLYAGFKKFISPLYRTWQDRRRLRSGLEYAKLYTREDIERATTFYIPPNCQQIDPAGAGGFIQRESEVGLAQTDIENFEDCQAQVRLRPTEEGTMNRRMKLLTGEVYHIYNRGNHKAEIFHDRQDYLYFLRQLRDYLREFAVTLIAYCLMPNHYHLLSRQDGDDAISDLMQAFGTSVSKTYNTKYQTVGSLFQGKFRDEHVGDNGYLMHLARYIHRNPVKAGLCTMPEQWEFSNYRDVLGQRKGKLCDFSKVLASLQTT